jgi:hypothetical protein
LQSPPSKPPIATFPSPVTNIRIRIIVPSPVSNIRIRIIVGDKYVLNFDEWCSKKMAMNEFVTNHINSLFSIDLNLKIPNKKWKVLIFVPCIQIKR